MLRTLGAKQILDFRFSILWHTKKDLVNIHKNWDCGDAFPLIFQNSKKIHIFFFVWEGGVLLVGIRLREKIIWWWWPTSEVESAFLTAPHLLQSFLFLGVWQAATKYNRYKYSTVWSIALNHTRFYLSSVDKIRGYFFSLVDSGNKWILTIWF